MTVASNLYASKVFAEHSVASWPLDDEVSYISLIDDATRSFDAWPEINNGTYSDYLPFPDNPFPGGPFPYSNFSELIATDSGLLLEAFSANLFNLEDLNQQMNTFAINMYLYTEDSVSYYQYGYRYIDPFSAQYVEEVRTVEDSRFSTWIRLGSTFNPPNVDAQAQLIFRVMFTGGTSPSVTMNGLSVGQWSEKESAKSLGVTPSLVSAEVQAMLGTVEGCVVQAYGVSSNDGYILSESGELLAVNSGIPMVYGSDNVTRLNPSASGLPSVIFPGMGVLNESGKYNSYTVEMWLRIENNFADARRIWGPLESDYGLYVKRGYLSLVIGNSIGSYFVADWYRPMLVHIVIRENAASVLINGEEVISLTYQTSELVLPTIDQDWFGFYCDEHMPIFEIDCISIFPYVIANQVAKRRFVWGQGVESPETINSAYEGTVAYIDYPFAEYTSNKSYPDLSRWDAAYFENLVATRRSVGVPDYNLPTISIGQKTLQDLYDDSYAIQEVDHARFMSFRPNDTWTDPCYYLFPSINVLTDVVRGVWGVFEVESATASSEPLIHFVDVNNGNRFEINIDGLTVSYKMYKSGILQSQTFEYEVEVDSHFVVGFHLPRLFESFGNFIGEFFGNPASIQMYVGGNGTDTFSGWIYRVGFSNQTNLDEIEIHFEENGIAIYSDGDLLNDHLGSYTLIPIEEFNRFYLDIGVSSYWEEYYPMSSFAGYVFDQFGNSIYDLDFIQYNVGYPTTTTIVENSTTGSWTYEELATEYASPVLRNYEALDNALITGYTDYDDLMNRVITIREYDFSQSSVRSYLTFQRVSDGANSPLNDYTISQSLPSTNVLDVSSFENQFSTKFEIKDQSVIYPPKSVAIKNLAAVLHLDINVYGIKTNPLNIRKMSLSSKTLNQNDFSGIGTRFGSKMYPYSKTGLYYDQKKHNPYSIYHDSSPYLYLTNYSGIEPLGLREFQVERGISLPINSQQAPNQKVSAIQLWIKYSDDSFPQVGTTLFSVDGSNTDIGFNMITDQSTSRGRLYAIDLNTKQEYTSLTFYQDGVQVVTPYIEKNKWTVIGVNFGSPINFSNYTGAINIFQSAVFNNISYYKATSLQEAQSTIYRRWENVDGVPLTPLDWQYWILNGTPYGKWDNVLKVAETGIYGVSPETLFKSYSGTNRQVVDDGSQLIVSGDGVVVFASGSTEEDGRVVTTDSPEWSSYTKKPV